MHGALCTRRTARPARRAPRAQVYPALRLRRDSIVAPAAFLLTMVTDSVCVCARARACL